MTAAASEHAAPGPALSRVEAALADAGCGPVRRGMAPCPGHDDRSPSLSIAQGREGVLLRCFAGCDTDRILRALDLEKADLFDAPRSGNGKAGASSPIVAEYSYTDEHGDLLFHVVRLEPKTFRQRRADGAWTMKGVRRVLYRLPEVVQAVAAGDRVYIVEGEKDADAARAAGLVATTCPGGAGKWRTEYGEALRGADVTIVADRDEAGRRHARQVEDALEGIAASVELREAVVGKDLADHLGAGRAVEELAPAELEDEPPASFERLPDDVGYRLTVPALAATVEVTYVRRERSQLRGEVLVRCDLPGASTFDGVLSVAEVNLSSTRSRRDHARHLAEQARTEPGPWSDALEEFAQRVLAAEREGEPDVALEDVEPEPIRVLEVAGLRVPHHHPTVLFGDGDSAKSYVALYVLGCLAQDGLRVGLADWELSEIDHRERLGRLFRSDLPPVRYLRCARPIVAESDRLRRWVRERKLDFVTFDSVAYACAGAPESAEVAMAYFQVIRQLGAIGTLHIAHITKAAEGADRRPFGSAFWHNSPRATWYAKLAERDPGGTVSRLGLYPRKWNVGPLPPSVGLELAFGAERTTVRRVDVAETPDLAAHLSVRQRMLAALRGGPMPAAELASEIDASPDTVKRTARRYRQQFGEREGAVLYLVESKR